MRSTERRRDRVRAFCAGLAGAHSVSSAEDIGRLLKERPASVDWPCPGCPAPRPERALQHRENPSEVLTFGVEGPLGAYFATPDKVVDFRLLSRPLGGFAPPDDPNERA